MTSVATRFVARRLFQEHIGNKQGQEDPYFETIPATRLGVNIKKKRKRALPPGLTPGEEKTLNKVKRRAYRLDFALFSLFGLRFGWGSVIGLIPFIGDFSDMLLALMVYQTACSVEGGLKASTRTMMRFNIVIDFVIGLVPFIGDLADAAYKCNTRNAILLEKELRARGAKRIAGTAQAQEADPSLGDDVDWIAEDDARRAHGPPPRYSSTASRGRDKRRVPDPEAAQAGSSTNATHA